MGNRVGIDGGTRDGQGRGGQQGENDTTVIEQFFLKKEESQYNKKIRIKK